MDRTVNRLGLVKSHILQVSKKQLRLLFLLCQQIFINCYALNDSTGQIALVPGSMTLIEGGIRPQCKLALRHLSRISKVMNKSDGQLRDVVQGICFVTHPNYIAEARRQLERRTTNAIMDYIVVPALPRKALVEWQVWVHSHNDKFDCKYLLLINANDNSTSYRWLIYLRFWVLF